MLRLLHLLPQLLSRRGEVKTQPPRLLLCRREEVATQPPRLVINGSRLLRVLSMPEHRRGIRYGPLGSPRRSRGIRYGPLGCPR